MCGIVGFTGEPQPEILEKMTDALTHRGPDDRGTFSDHNISLGHRRLSIIDLADSRQPMKSPDKKNVLVYNGEMYNYQNLRKRFAEDGWQFQTAGDTEVILAGYKILGEKKFVHQLSGMFAFALYDEIEKKVILARDRVGIKPLYYTVFNGRLVFASEVKAILEFPGIKAELETDSLYEHFTFRYTPGENTLFRGIKKLLPGHTLTFKNGSIKISRYWQPEFKTAETGSGDENVREFDELLTRSVRSHLIADVPVGAFLSGGLDSSYLVALMSKTSSERPRTFSVGFSDEAASELKYAELVAEKFSTNHRTLFCDRAEAGLLKKIAWHLDEPLADATTLPTWMMSRLTVQHVKVVLSGEGSDEFLGGYAKYRAVRTGEAAAPFIPPALGRLLEKIGRSNKHLERLGQFFSGGNPAARYLNLTSVFSDRNLKDLFTPEFYRKLTAGRNPANTVAPFFKRHKSVTNALLDLDVNTWLPNDLLLKNDKMTMAHSLEARVPYLDRDLMEFMQQVPADEKISLFNDKIILRKAMAGHLPAEIYKRPKTGFTVPIPLLMQGGLENVSNELMAQEKLKKEGVFNPDAVSRLKKLPLSNSFYRRQFYTVFSFLLWMDVFNVKF